jgi:hypothetical protein
VGVPWIAANGSSESRDLVWSGQSAVDSVPTDTETCSDWVNPSGTAMLGSRGSDDSYAFVGLVAPVACDSITGYLYCIEP